MTESLNAEHVQNMAVSLPHNHSPQPLMVALLCPCPPAVFSLHSSQLEPFYLMACHPSAQNPSVAPTSLMSVGCRADFLSSIPASSDWLCDSAQVLDLSVPTVGLVGNTERITSQEAFRTVPERS